MFPPKLPTILASIVDCKSSLIRHGRNVGAALASAGLAHNSLNVQPWKCLSSSEKQQQQRSTPNARIHSLPKVQKNSRKGVSWHTYFTHDFGISLPIIGVPMAGTAGARLAYEITRAGGLGVLGGEHSLASATGYIQLCEQIEEFQNQHQHFQQQQQQRRRGGDIHIGCNHMRAPLCIGFISHSCLNDKRGWDRLESILIEQRPKAVQFLAPHIVHHPERRHVDNIHFAQSYGAKVVVQVGTFRDAQQALQAGVDALIVQGQEREHASNATLALALDILAYRESNPIIFSTTTPSHPISNIPILATGGIMDARSMAAMMAAGLDGVVMDERFQNAVMGATNASDDTIGTQTCNPRQSTYGSEHVWTDDDSVGAFRNDAYRQWVDRSNELEFESKRKDSDLTQSYHPAVFDGKPDIDSWVLAGHGSGRIYNFVRGICQEAADILKSTPRRLFGQVEI